MAQISFANDQEIIDFAECFLKGRLASLENDIKRCLFEEKALEGKIGQPAPFPALLYCFAIIDLLSALNAGETKFDPGDHARATKGYMTKFMLYKDHEVNFIQDVFRHRLVHVSEPSFTFPDGKKRFSWKHDEEQRKRALVIDRDNSGMFKICGKDVPHDGVLTISIYKLKDDILDSVSRPHDGFLARIGAEKDQRDRFKDAMLEILSS